MVVQFNAPTENATSADVDHEPHLSSSSHWPVVAADFYQGPARDFAQLCRAFALVQDRYMERGYTRSNETGMRYSLWNFLPHTTTFVVEEGPHIFGTLTIVIDSVCGLPGENEFSAEYSELRSKGRFVAEATMFACDSTSPQITDISGKLMTLACRWCIEAGIDDLCLIINPRHVRFYERILGFQRIGVEKPMNHVEGNAGIFLRCDIATVLEQQDNLSSRAGRLFKTAIQAGKLSFNRYELKEVEAAVLLDGAPEVFLDANPAQQAEIDRLYPIACVHLRSSYGTVDTEGIVPDDEIYPSILK